LRINKKMNKDIIKKLFPGAWQRIKTGQCPICGKPIKPEDFKDRLSLREFEISGMCQSCQDETFKNNEE
jgi:hypothetical protein